MYESESDTLITQEHKQEVAIKLSNTVQTLKLFISDDSLYETYNAKQTHLNLLGNDPKCKNKFKAVPVGQKIFRGEPKVAEIQQSVLGNCIFLVLIRAIVRRNPSYIYQIIQETPDERYVIVKLFQYRDGEYIPVEYQIEKSHILPSDKASLLYLHAFFMQLFSIGHKASWVNLLEKAIVLHFRENPNDSTSTFTEKVCDDYADAIVVERRSIYAAVLGGCSYEPFSNTKLLRFTNEELRDRLSKELMNGEIITNGFWANNPINMSAQHLYEVIGVCSGKMGTSYAETDFVIMSNPWGFPTTLSWLFPWYKKPYFDSMEYVKSPSSLEQMKEDPGAFVIPLEDFRKNAISMEITINASFVTKRGRELSKSQPEGSFVTSVNLLLEKLKVISREYLARGAYSYWHHSYVLHAKFLLNYTIQIENDLANGFLEPSDATYMIQFMHQLTLTTLDGKTSSLVTNLKELSDAIAQASSSTYKPKSENEVTLQAQMRFIKGCYRFLKNQQLCTRTSEASRQLLDTRLNPESLFGSYNHYLENPLNVNKTFHKLINNFFKQEVFIQNGATPSHAIKLF